MVQYMQEPCELYSIKDGTTILYEGDTTGYTN